MIKKFLFNGQELTLNGNDQIEMAASQDISIKA